MPGRAAFAPITPDAIDKLAALVSDAFAGYRTFAPDGWRPPAKSEHRDGLQRWMRDPDFWGEMALEPQALIGHSALIPAARHSFRPEPDPALAHLGHLFVRPRYWGTGVAVELLAHATAAAAARGCSRM